MKIYLIGLKNSGKTTTGKRLANKLNLNFIDLDQLIEKINGRSVTEIFSQDGEPVFREKEREALLETSKMDNVVIATGGGVPRFYDNMDFMNKNGITVYLKLDEDTLVGRLKVAAKDRPVMKGKTTEQIRDYVQNILQHHEHIYLRANYVVDSKNLTPGDLATKISMNYTGL